MILYPNCKINLGLNILQKREDGFHDLETIFYPVDLTDALEIIPAPHSKESVLSLSGLELDAMQDDNICIRAWKMLKNDFKDLPAVSIHLHKMIPSGAGLGGGSADGAFTILQLNKLFRLGLNREQLIKYALQLGSDCPFFIINQPCLARGRGEILNEIKLDLTSYTIILVNPGIHINTGWAFSQLDIERRPASLTEIIQSPLEHWKDMLKNDFEKPVFEKYSSIGKIKQQLYEAGAVYSSLSGSGSTVFGIFAKNVNPVLDFSSSYLVKTI